MTVKRVALNMTSDASGDVAHDTPEISGEILQITYQPPGSGAFADHNVSVTSESGVTVYSQNTVGTSAFSVAPRQPTHDSAGVASLYAGSGEPVEAPYCVARERLTVTIANAGNGNSGTYHIYYRE